MNKKYLKIFITLIVVCLVSGAAFYFIYQNKKNTTATNTKTSTETKAKDLMTAKEKEFFHLYGRGIYEVISRDATGKATKFKLIGLEEAQPLKLELMADSDKLKHNLATSTKIQILKRDDTGKVVQYRIMASDKDILKVY